MRVTDGIGDDQYLPDGAEDETSVLMVVDEELGDSLTEIGIDNVDELAVCHALWVFTELNEQSETSISEQKAEIIVIYARRWVNVYEEVVPMNEGVFVTGDDNAIETHPLSELIADDGVTVSGGKTSEPSLDAEVLSQDETLTDEE